MTINGKPTTDHGAMRIGSRVSHSVLHWRMGTVTAIDLPTTNYTVTPPALDTLVLWDRGVTLQETKAYLHLIT